MDNDDKVKKSLLQKAAHKSTPSSKDKSKEKSGKTERRKGTERRKADQKGAVAKREFLEIERRRGLERRAVDRSQLYSFERELANTKKNKSLMVRFITLAFIAVVSLSALGITSYIQYKNRHIEIEIADFEDINLKDILSAAKKNENTMQQLTRNLEDLQLELVSKIQDIRSQMDNDIELVNEMDLAKSEKERRIRLIRQDAEQKINTLSTEYNQKIESIEKEIEATQQKIDQYDQRMMEQVKKQEQVLNSQQQVHDIEMEKTVSYYEQRIEELTTSYTKEIEAQKQHLKTLTATLKNNHRREIEQLILKYNPVFTAEDVSRILARELPSDIAQEEEEEEEFHEYLYELDGLLSENEMQQLRRDIMDRKILLSRLLEIPYENSIPETLSHLKILSELIEDEYEDLWYELAMIVRERDEVVDQYRFCFKSLIQNTRESGYIIDAREPEDVITFMNPNYTIKDGDLGLIFRKDDEYIGSIIFKTGPQGISAVVEKIEEEKTIEPFDKILVQKK